MKILLKIILSLFVFLASAFTTLFWLAIPLIVQVIIDKVIAQTSADSLSVLGVFLIMTTLFASASEVGLSILSRYCSRAGFAEGILLSLAFAVPRILISLVLMSVYNVQLLFASIVLTSIAGGTYYLLKKPRLLVESSSDPLPLSFRLPLTLITLFIFWYGSFLVIKNLLSLGQLVAFSIITIQVVALVLGRIAAIMPLLSNGTKNNAKPETFM